MAARRGEIQAEIRQVGAKREQFITREMKAKSLDDDLAFDSAVRGAIRDRPWHWGSGSSSSHDQ